MIDKMPTKYLIIPGFFLIWVSGYIFVASKNYVALLISRCSMGLGMSMTWDPMVARLSHLTPKEEHGAATGIFRAGNAIASGLVSIASGYLAIMFGVKNLLWGSAGFALICGLVLLFVHKEIIYKGKALAQKHHFSNFHFPVFNTTNK